MRIIKGEFTKEEKLVVLQLYEDNLLYIAALKELQTRAEILREDFRKNECYNPIEHIKTRIKKPESIIKKVYLKNWPLDVETIKENMHDIAGMRIVCTFKDDIYRISEIFQNSKDIKVLEIKDYIATQKPSGYQSYHMIVEIPVQLSSGIRHCKVEIQLRTMAMDFWASLEHKIKYKYEWELPDEIKDELRNCSEIVDELDNNMQALYKKVHQDIQEKE